MTRRPTIEELHDDLLFKKIAAVEHDRIKDFVVEQVTGDNKLVPVYMVYQTLMLLTGLFFLRVPSSWHTAERRFICGFLLLPWPFRLPSWW